MKKIFRLTALLLALMMIFSSAVSAESLQIGGTSGMTAQDWAELVDNAEKQLYVINEGDSGKEVTPEQPDQPEQSAYYPYTDGVTVALADEDVTGIAITESGVAVLTNASAGQWQMKIGEMWADIAGEAGSTLSVTGAMMNGLSTAEVRKALGDETYTGVATVSIVDSLPATLSSVQRDDASTGDTSGDASDTNNGVMTLEAANEGLTKSIITINYLFKSNSSPAATSYYAQVNTTQTAFSAVVKHPTIQGYQPTAAYDGTLPTGFEYTQEQITITDAKISEDVTINVYFEPADNTFTVKYWEELVEYTTDTTTGEEVKYELKETKTYNGKTEAAVSTAYEKDEAQYFATLHNPDGFKALMYDENVAIAADGSTVVNIYYQRLYYLIAFELDGGYGTNPVYVKYEADIGTVADPVKPGYTFKGWTDAEGSTTTVNLPTAMPLGGKTYYAVWEAQQVTYTVAYWLEDPEWVDETPDDATDNEGRYDYLGQQQVEALSGTTTNVADYAELPEDIANTLNVHLARNVVWAENGPDAIVEGDGSTIINVYYDRKEFRLRFYYAMSHMLNDGTTEYKVVGGNTYPFGSVANGSISADEIKLLQQFSTGDQKGTTGVVESEITLKDGVTCYTVGTVTPENDSYSYHYIQFNAKYGQKISALWPVDVFNPVPTNANSYWNGGQAFVAGWNGEHHVWYSQKNSNETIKGSYGVLDYQILWDYAQFGQYGDGDAKNEVAYLCFWENGANVSWSIPELYRYHIYVEVLPGHVAKDTDVVYNGKTYARRDCYDTIDDSWVNQQTQPALTGLTGLATYDQYNNLTGGYDYVQVVNILKTYNNGNKDVVQVYERATIANGKLTQAHVNQFKTIEAEIQATEIYAGEDCTDRDGDGDAEANEREPLYNDAFFMYFYYDRQTFDLVKINGSETSVVEGLLYEQSLAGYGDAPAWSGDQTIGMGYQFEGWYTSATFEADTKVNFDTATMPASNLTVYAKWVPIYHSVFVYNTRELAEEAAGKLTDVTPEEAPPEGVTYLYYWLNVAHGQPTSSAFTYDNDTWYDKDNQSFKDPTRPGYTFTLWFYLDDNGDAQPFAFGATPITRDTIVFAGWTAKEYAQYKIYYVIQPNDATKADAAAYKAYYENEANWVAASLNGNGLVGAYVTENAKGGTDLNEGYQSGWFPTLESHSFFLEDVNVEKNVYVFEYVQADAVPYTVHYVTAVKPADADTKTYDTIVIDGKIYYKLANSKTEDKNTKAVVTENYVQVGGNYVPDAFQKRLILQAGSTGNQIVFYYTPDDNRTTLEVNHILVHADGTETTYDSVKQIIDLPKDVEIETKAIANYTYDPTRTTRQDGNGSPATLETLKFELAAGAQGVVVNLYYVEETVTINYVAVGPADATDFGSVTPTAETVGVVTGEPNGSTAAAGKNCQFVGWYSDVNCTILVGTDPAYAPEKVNGVHVAATYYAKFEYLPGRLDIVKNVVNNTGEALTQTVFNFTVTLTDAAGHVLTGTLEYTIGEQSYTATLANGSFELPLDVGTVTADTTTASASASIANLPYGVQYVVTEEAVDNCTTTVDNVQGTIPAGDTVTATITNTFPAATVSTLTVTKEGMSNGESAIFEVMLKTGTYMVVLNDKNPSETIINVPIDSEYTVTELNSWSWRYTTDQEAKTGTIQKDGNKVEFSNSRTNTQWMSDESCVVNNVTEGTEIDNLNNK